MTFFYAKKKKNRLISAWSVFLLMAFGIPILNFQGEKEQKKNKMRENLGEWQICWKNKWWLSCGYIAKAINFLLNV